MNRTWHEKHPMPKRAPMQTRITWHLAHRRACACRPIPAGVLAAMGEREAAASIGAKPSLRRPLEPMPADVRRLLAARGLTRAYGERPSYQRNDYLRWFARAKLSATRQKRIEQMLTELARGGVYMKMKWAGGKPGAAERAAAGARPTRKAR